MVQSREEKMKWQKEYYQKNKKKINERSKIWAKKNKKKRKKIEKKYIKSKKAKLTRKNWRFSKKGKVIILLSAAKSRAKQFNLKFDLSYEWLEEILIKGICEETGLAFSFDKPRVNYRTHPFAPSIERVNPKGSYCKTNVKIVVNCYNQMKWDWQLEDFKVLVKIIYKGLVKKHGKIKQRSKNISLPKRKKNNL